MATVLCEGPMYKLGGGLVQRLQERYFVLTSDANLTYYEKKGQSDAKGTIFVAGAKVVDRGTYMDKQCFTLEGANVAKGVKEYFLFADDKNIKWMWVCAIMKATGRYDFVSDEGDLSRLEKSPVAAELKKEGNTTCADCDAATPTWAVVAPFGVFVCIECVGVHRNLWAGKCKEVQLDSWGAEETSYIASRGNTVCNAELEQKVTDEATTKPVPWSKPAIRTPFIEKKYNKGFVLSPEDVAAGANPSPIPRDAQPKPANFGTQTATAAGEPPRYTGVAFVMLVSSDRFAVDGAVAALTNGFQEVRSMPGKKTGDGTQWTQPLQIGLDSLKRPLYITMYDGNKISCTAEIVLSDIDDVVGDTPQDVRVPLLGKGAPPGAILALAANFAKLT